MMLLLGATGLLGTQVLKRMRESRFPIRLFVRGSHDWQSASVQNLRQHGIEVVVADVLNFDKLEQATQGCTAIINLVGVMRPDAEVDVQAIHVEAVSKLVEIAQAKRIQRFLHVSCLGSQPQSDCLYLNSKWQSEQIVSSGRYYWTIFRPSFLFAETFPLLEVLLPLIRFKPFMPVLGSGLNRIQPVFADNVAECIVRSLYDKGTVAKTFDLGGPDIYSLQEIMVLARQQLKLRGAAFNLPGEKATKLAGALAKYLPQTGITSDLAELLLSNSYTESNALSEYFKIKPKPLTQCLDEILAD